MIEMSPHFTEGIQWDTGYICAAPCGDLAVTVLADNERMNAAAVHAQMFAKSVFQPAVSRTVPEPMTLFSGSPLSFNAT